VVALRPTRAPHESARHVNVASTDTRNGVPADDSRQRGVNENRGAQLSDV
jgi:hypothetical protein